MYITFPKIIFLGKKYKSKRKLILIFLLSMPKNEGKQNFSFLSIPKVGQKAMSVEIKRERERERKSDSQC